MACHAALAKSQNKRLIKSVWVAHGFRSSSDFSRSFRREFGYSPSDVGVEKFALAAPLGFAETRTDITQFHGWIRSLRA
jgi:AraC-like DNA-binding protein